MIVGIERRHPRQERRECLGRDRRDADATRTPARSAPVVRPPPRSVSSAPCVPVALRHRAATLPLERRTPRTSPRIPRSRSYRSRRAGSLSQSWATLMRFARSRPCGPATSGWWQTEQRPPGDLDDLGARVGGDLEAGVQVVGGCRWAWRHGRILLAAGSPARYHPAVSFMKRAREAAEPVRLNRRRRRPASRPRTPRSRQPDRAGPRNVLAMK